MPTFEYKAATPDGDVVEGHLEAGDTQDAARQLKAQGRVPIRIAASAAHLAGGRDRGLFGGAREGRLKARDIELLTLELSTLLGAGLQLGQALETAQQLAEKPALSDLCRELSKAIRGGAELSEAMARHPQHFDRFYLNMVRAGESTGELGMALDRLVEFRANARELRGSLLSALLYPGILFVLSIVAVVVMLAFVVPQFTAMFADAGREMPLLTRIVAGTGDVLTNWWWLILGALGAAFVWLRQDWRSSAGRERWDRRLLRLPLLGRLLTQLETARLTRTLATLLQNGVTLLVAMDIAKEIVGNHILAGAVARAATRVRQGERLARALGDTQRFPTLAVQLIRLGEESGKLEHMLDQTAGMYEKDVQNGLRRLLTLAEPVIIVMIALFITVIILSVVLMIMESNNLPF